MFLRKNNYCEGRKYWQNNFIIEGESMKKNLKAKFSIYKIDIQKIIKITGTGASKDIGRLLKIMCSYIIDLINNKKPININKIKAQGFIGVYFETSNVPNWKCLIQDMIEKSFNKEEKNELRMENIRASYILFYIVNNSIYACTGGLGSNYIKRFIDYYFGLYLIPKIFEKTHPILKKVIENDLIGNRLTSQFTNRNLTSFINEEDLSLIYKQMNIEIDRKLSEEFGIQFGENENKNKMLMIENKDSLVINRSLSLNELKDVIARVDKLEQKKEKFALSYFIFAGKNGVKDSELVNILINKYFLQDKFDSFSIVSDDFEQYYFNSDKFYIKNNNGDILLERENPITLTDVFDMIKGKNEFNKTKILSAIKKFKIHTTDTTGEELLYPISLYQSLQGFMEHDGTTYYLMNGKWYFFNNKYLIILNGKYESLYCLFEKDFEELIKRYKLSNLNELNENEYNKTFQKSKNIIFAHTTLVCNVELADLIFWDDNNLYLMHNKIKFDGVGVRDLSNQILVASELLLKSKLDSNSKFMKEYFDSLKNKKGNEYNKIQTTSEDEFINAFDKNIVYIAGFIENYKKDTESTYAKYLVCDLNKRLMQGNFKLIVADLSNGTGLL